MCELLEISYQVQKVVVVYMCPNRPMSTYKFHKLKFVGDGLLHGIKIGF